jgi:hypothetical protein
MRKSNTERERERERERDVPALPVRHLSASLAASASPMEL